MIIDSTGVDIIHLDTPYKARGFIDFLKEQKKRTFVCHEGQEPICLGSVYTVVYNKMADDEVYRFDANGALKVIMSYGNVEFHAGAAGEWVLSLNANDYFCKGSSMDVEFSYSDLKTMINYLLIDPVYGLDVWMILKEQRIPYDYLDDINKNSNFIINEMQGDVICMIKHTNIDGF